MPATALPVPCPPSAACAAAPSSAEIAVALGRLVDASPGGRLKAADAGTGLMRTLPNYGLGKEGLKDTITTRWMSGFKWVNENPTSFIQRVN